MPRSRTNTITSIRTLLQLPGNDEEIFDADISDVLIDNALQEYSRHRPQRLRFDFFGVGESRYHLPTSWTLGFSKMLGVYNDLGDSLRRLDPNTVALVEYVDRTQRALAAATSGATSVTFSTVANAAYFRKGDPIEIKNSASTTGMQNNWALADGNGTTGVLTLRNALSATLSSTPVVRKAWHMRFLDTSPNTTDYYALEYTAQHTHTETEDTIFDADYTAFTMLCAALVAQSLAGKFSRSVDSALEASAVDFGGLSAAWAARATEWRKLYEAHIAGGAVATAGAQGSNVLDAGGAMRSLEMRRMNGERPLLHSRRGLR